MLHCTEGEGRPGETHHANRRILKAGRPGSLLEGDPNLKWILGREFMESQRRREADNCLWYFAADLHQRPILRGWVLARRIESLANPFELPCSDQTAQVIARYVQPDQITRPYNGLLAGVLQ
jgi:hypothetical protein